MAGTVVATQTLLQPGVSGVLSITGGIKQVVKTSIAWTSDASGAVSGNSVQLPMGTILQVGFTPGAGGVQPTDLYDITMTCDSHPAVNILDDGTGSASVGANLSNANASHKTPFVAGGSVTYYKNWLHGGGYTLVVAAAGNAKSGTVDIYQSLDS